MNKFIISLALVLISGAAAFAQNKSVYTNLNTTVPSCKTVKSDERLPVYSGICEGVAGYQLGLNEDDERQSISVIAPDGKVTDLDFWGYFRNFSYVGEKAEWRMKGGTPVALIVRYNVSDKGDAGGTNSYLMVARITKKSACVTDIVKPGKSQNLVAQRLADRAATKACKPVPE